MGREYGRIRALAKAFARMQGATCVLYRNEDDTFGFMPADEECGNKIIEYITPY